jgi:hypothetical protein
VLGFTFQGFLLGVFWGGVFCFCMGEGEFFFFLVIANYAWSLFWCAVFCGLRFFFLFFPSGPFLQRTQDMDM